MKEAIPIKDWLEKILLKEFTSGRDSKFLRLLLLLSVEEQISPNCMYDNVCTYCMYFVVTWGFMLVMYRWGERVN